MNKKTLVTIITPCYNGEEYIDKYFEAILNQTYDNLELIFVNDGSTDKTEEIALSYREKLEIRGIVYKYLYQPNGGQAKAMNTGFKEMTGKYLVWPDSDDIITPDSIEKRVAFLEHNPQYDFVRSGGSFFNYETGEYLYPLSAIADPHNEDIFLDLILEETYCACGCYMIKTEMLKNIYPDLIIFESCVGQNWQILIPIAGKGKCGYIDEDLYHIALRTDSHSRQKRTLQEEVDRRMGLKEVLEIGITLSGRTDRDYKKIVDMKYQRILFGIYLRAGEKEQAEKCYNALRDGDSVTNDIYAIYLEHFKPVKYKFFCWKNLAVRGVRKIKRIIKGK